MHPDTHETHYHVSFLYIYTNGRLAVITLEEHKSCTKTLQYMHIHMKNYRVSFLPDNKGSYAYDQQPRVCRWNLSKLTELLVSLIQTTAHVPAADADSPRVAGGSGSETWLPPAGDCQHGEDGQTQGGHSILCHSTAALI